MRNSMIAIALSLAGVGIAYAGDSHDIHLRDISDASCGRGPTKTYEGALFYCRDFQPVIDAYAGGKRHHYAPNIGNPDTAIYRMCGFKIVNFKPDGNARTEVTPGQNVYYAGFDAWGEGSKNFSNVIFRFVRDDPNFKGKAEAVDCLADGWLMSYAYRSAGEAYNPGGTPPTFDHCEVNRSGVPVKICKSGGITFECGPCQ